MTKLFLFLVLLSITISGQKTDKGFVKFIFNGELVTMQLTSVHMLKENNIILNMRADYTDSTVNRTFDMQLVLNSLSVNEKKDFDCDIYQSRIQYYTRNIQANSGNELMLNFPGNEGRFGKFGKGERITWEITSLQMKIEDAAITYDKDKLSIAARFALTLRCTIDGVTKKEIAELKEGSFEIKF